jgi:hypothetical protein
MLGLTRCNEFVKEATKTFDESHDYKHAIEVCSWALTIFNGGMDSFDIIEAIPETSNPYVIEHAKNYHQKRIAWIAMLHDVCDKKYKGKGAISKKKLTDFVNNEFGRYEGNKLSDVILSISFSKEREQRQNGTYVNLPEPYETYKKIVSDADRLCAIGKAAFFRTARYFQAHGGDVISGTVGICRDKLLQYYPDGYIKTNYACKIAEPLHYELLEFVEKIERFIETVRDLADENDILELLRI